MGRQEILEDLLSKELKRLRLIFFPYGRRKFLDRPITIRHSDIRKDGQLGLYKKIKGKNEFDFTHEITIDSGIIDSYMNFKPFLYYYGASKKQNKEVLIRTINHELIHCFIEDYYACIFTDIAGMSCDASPIFLGVLFWWKNYGYSSYPFIKGFKKSKLYLKIQEFETFKELDYYITKLILEYQKLNKKPDSLEENMVNDVMVTNSFMFGDSSIGLHGCSKNVIEYVHNCNNGLKAIEINIYKIGACMLPEDIKKVINRKRYGFFDKKEYIKVGISKDGKSVKTICKYTA